MLTCSVKSDSATPWTVARQAPLSIRILQTRILEWVAMPSSRASSQPRDWSQVSCTGGGFLTSWATGKPLFPWGVPQRSLAHLRCLVLNVPTVWDDPLPRSPPIRIALLFQGPDPVSPDLCCPRITLPRSDSLTGVPLLQGRAAGSVHLPGPQLWLPLLVLNLFLQEMGSYLKASVSLVNV